MISDLTDMQEKFVYEYLVDLKPMEAAIRAGYSPKTADSMGSQLLRLDKVQERISIEKSIWARNSAVSKEKVLSHLRSAVEADYTDAFEVDFQLKSKDDIPLEIRKHIQSVSVMKKSTKFGEDLHVKVTFVDKARCLELIGKHLGLFEAQSAGQGFTLVIGQAETVHVESTAKPVDMGEFIIDVPFDRD